MKNAILILVCVISVSCGKTKQVEGTSADSTVVATDTVVVVTTDEFISDSKYFKPILYSCIYIFTKKLYKDLEI